MTHQLEATRVTTRRASRIAIPTLAGLENAIILCCGVITSVVHISADRKAIPTLGEALAAVEGFSEVYSVTGPMDFIAMVRAREHDELAEIVTQRIGQVPGVVRTDTHVAFKMYSRHDLESLFSIGAAQPAK